MDPDRDLEPAPRPPAIFVGREADLDRFTAAAEHVRLGLIYGVGGSGKTAFVLRGAERLAAQLGARVIYHPCRAGESISTVSEVVHRAAGRIARGPATRALVELGRASPLVVCLDDLHRAVDTGLVEALVHLAHAHAPLWVCAASRSDLAIDPTRVDHVVIRLAGLSPEDSERLWSQLERLYGPARRPREAARAQTPPARDQASVREPRHRYGRRSDRPHQPAARVHRADRDGRRVPHAGVARRPDRRSAAARRRRRARHAGAPVPDRYPRGFARARDGGLLDPRPRA